MSQKNLCPSPSDVTEPYWRATRDRRLLLQWCPACERYIHHPRQACPGCLSTELEWRESSGSGLIHAISIHYRPFESMGQEDCPYAVAFVDLDEGVRFLANIVADNLGAVKVGDSVVLNWRPVADGFNLPEFHVRT